MAEPLTKTYSRFYTFIIFTNLATFALLTFWIWQYCHDGLIVSAGVDSFFNRRVSFSIFNRFIFEPYVVNLLIGLPTTFLGLGSIVSVIEKRLEVTYILLSILSGLVLIACILMQSEIDLLHIWKSAMASAYVIYSCSLYSRDGREHGEQESDEKFLATMKFITILWFCMSTLADSYLADIANEL